MQRASPGKNNSSPFSHLVPTAVEFPLFFYFEIDNVIQNVLQFHITISFRGFHFYIESSLVSISIHFAIGL